MSWGRPMTVSDLRRLLLDVDGDTPIVVRGSDHSFRFCSASATSAIWHERGRKLTEDLYGEDVPPDEGEERRNVVVFE